MSGSARFVAALGSLAMALQAFGNDSGQLGLPHWAWIACGAFWLVWSVRFIVGRSA